MAKKPRSSQRGRTRAGRLRLLDQLLLEQRLLSDAGGHFRAVDVGFGDAPITTEELRRSLSAALPESTVEVIGLERDPARAEHARRTSPHPSLIFRTGSFEACSRLDPSPRLVRVMNVLRGYRLEEVAPAQAMLIEALAPGGLLLEGSSDKEGHLLTAHLWWKPHPGQRRYGGLVVGTDFVRGFAPRMFRDVLPRDLRRHASGDEPIAQWLGAWQTVVDTLRRRAPDQDNARVFAESVEHLAQTRKDTRADLGHGVVLWQPPRPSGRAEVLAPILGRDG